jgi:hypothetical protein
MSIFKGRFFFSTEKIKTIWNLFYIYRKYLLFIFKGFFRRILDRNSHSGFGKNHFGSTTSISWDCPVQGFLRLSMWFDRKWSRDKHRAVICLAFVSEEQRLALKQGLEENIKHIRVYKGKSHISFFAIL